MTMQVRFTNQPRLQVRVVALPSSSGGSGAVASVFGRTGTVVASAGDYTGSQITNVPSGAVTATNVQSAINQLASGGSAVTPAALTAVNDTNVTASLGGTPTTALLQATSVTLGWTGTLAIARGGTGTSTFTPFVGSPLLNVDDTNVTLAWSGASATAVSGTTTVTAGWTGTLAVSRGGLGTGTWAGTNSLVSSGVNATGTIQVVANSATTGTVMRSNGAAALPSFGAALVVGGGTGSTTWATNTVFVGGTTATGTFQQVAGGTSGTVLTAQGAGVIPIFAAVPAGTEATQAQQEAGTATTVYVSPAKQKFHPSAAKAWADFTGASGTIVSSYNVATVTRTAAGAYDVVFTTPFSSADYAVIPNLEANTDLCLAQVLNGKTSTTVTMVIRSVQNLTLSAPAAFDPTRVTFVAYGDQ